MAVKYTKTHVSKIAALLDQEWDSAEQAAEAVLDAALEILEKRAAFVVVGQLRYSRQEGGWIDPEDAKAAKICLGFYSTQGDADKAAYALTYSAATHEEFRAWSLPVEHCTPAEAYQKRKQMHHERELAKRKGEAA